MVQLTREDLHTSLLSQLLGLLFDLNIERQYDGILGRLVQHGTSLDNGALVHRSNAKVEHRDLHLVQEGKKSFKGTQSTGLNPDTLARLGHKSRKRSKVVHSHVLERFNLVIILGNIKTGTSDRLFETRSRDLDTQSGLDFFVVDVLTLKWNISILVIAEQIQARNSL